MVSITKLVVYGLVGAFALSALIDPARAQGTISAFGGIGTALGNLGTGLLSLGTGAGTGIAKLFNPLFTLRDLIYGPQAGVQVQAEIRDGTSTGIITNNAAAQQQIQLDPNAPITHVPDNFVYDGGGGGSDWRPVNRPLGVSFYTDYSISPHPVADVNVHGVDVPLSQEAIDWYNEIGVTVSPQNPGTVAANNSGNANSFSSSYTSANVSSLGSSQGGGGFGASSGVGGATSSGGNNNAATGGFGAAN
jgi:hypothetical protein